MNDTRSRDDLLAGAIFVALGGAFAYTASTYDVGTLRAMGPGYFPLALGLVLAALGVVIMAIGLYRRRGSGAMAPAPASAPASGPRSVSGPQPVAPDRGTAEVDAEVDAQVDATGGTEPDTGADERGSVPWGRAALLLGAILFFGATIGGLGVAPALLVTILLAALAGHGTTWRTAAIISVGLTALCVVIFVLLLQLRLPIIGPWLGG